MTENIKPPEVAAIPTELKENFSQQFDLSRLLMHKNFCFYHMNVNYPWANIYFVIKKLNLDFFYSLKEREFQ